MRSGQTTVCSVTYSAGDFPSLTPSVGNEVQLLLGCSGPARRVDGTQSPTSGRLKKSLLQAVELVLLSSLPTVHMCVYMNSPFALT